MHPHAHLELVDAQPFGSRPPLVDGLDHMVRRGLHEIAVGQSDPPYRLPAVVLDRDDACDAVGVVDLLAH